MGRRRFGREFKLEAVKLVRERGVTVAQAARDLVTLPLFALVHDWTLFSMWSQRDRAANSLGVRPPMLVWGRRAL